MSKKMLIDARHPEETRVAVVQGGKVEDFDFETASRRPLRGNIYLARITRVEPSLQAAFVEYGGNRHGFLAFGEIHPDYYQIPVSDREILRAAEALEAELAAKLAELGQPGAERDEDEDGADRAERPERADRTDRAQRVADSDAGDEGAATAGTDDADGAAQSREGGARRPRRRRRGGRNRGGASSQDAANQDTGSSDATAAGSADEAGDDDTAEPNAALITDHDQADSAAGDVIASHDDAEAAGPLADASPETDTGEAPSEPKAGSGDERSQPLAARTPPSISEAAHDYGNAADDADTAGAALHIDAPAADDMADEASHGDSLTGAMTDDLATDDDDIDVSAGRDDAEEVTDLDDADESESETADGATGDEGGDDLPPVDPAEIRDLERRYAEARRERDRLLRNYRIQEVIKRRQIMLVQVVKEERGNKGAALTTYLSLAGRYGVLMPNNSRGGGVSRKITSQADRRRLRSAISELDVPKGQGLIIRTAGAKQTKADIRRDYEYLARLWDTIRDQTLKSIAPCLIYEEASLIKRAIRDLFDKDTEQLVVEGESGFREAHDFMTMLMPHNIGMVQQYRDMVPMFQRLGVERQLDEMYRPVVQLKSGGYIVIQQTEALISIDVNSGKSTRERNVEATALKTNLEAAAEVSRQCRLRDLAGLIVVDFIDMEENRNNRTVEKKFKDAMKLDRARIQIGGISGFGLLEMSRQRRRSGIVDGTTRSCPSCDGAGVVRSVEMAALRVLRTAEEHAANERVGLVTVRASSDVALYVLNQKRAWLSRIEQSYDVQLTILADHTLMGDQVHVDTAARSFDSPAAIHSHVAYTDGAAEEAPDPFGFADEPREAPIAEPRAPAPRQSTPAADAEDGARGGRRRRRRRGGRDGEDRATPAIGETPSGDEAEAALDADREAPPTTRSRASSRRSAAEPVAADAETTDTDAEGGDGNARGGRRRRRGRRGGRGEGAGPRGAEALVTPGASADDTDTGADVHSATGAAADTVVSMAAEMPAMAASATPPADMPVVAPKVGAPDTLADERKAAAEAAAEEARQRRLAAVHEVVASAEAPAGPKRVGWWQRAFRREG